MSVPPPATCVARHGKRQKVRKCSIETWRSRDDIYTTIIDSDWSWAFINEAHYVTESVINKKDSSSSAIDSLEDMRLIESMWRKINV